MRRITFTALLLGSMTALATLVLWSNDAAVRQADAHCQVPCGIYDDPARIAQLREDATTIEKAIVNIGNLADNDDGQSVNQLIRWTVTKEEHASHVISVVSEYFLTQKTKPVAKGADGYDAYLARLADHHAVMVAAMKCKQNANQDVVKELRQAIDALAVHYMPQKAEADVHVHPDVKNGTTHAHDGHVHTH